MQQIQPYLDYFSAHPDWAIAIVFLVALGEALLIIGLFVPSTVVLVGAGMLVGTGHLGFWPVFWATAVGAIFGDQISFWAGRIFGDRLKSMWPLNKFPTLVTKGEDFVRLHGGKSIAVGRFVPGVKAVVPGIVGMLGMSQIFFLVVNVTSGLFWTAAHIFPGILLGQGLALAGDLSGQLFVVLLVLFGVLGVAGWIIRVTAARLQPYTHRLLAKLSIWARSRKNRALHRFGKAIRPGNPRAPAIAFLLFIAIASLVALIDLVSGFVLRQAASNLDVSVATLMGELRNAPADAFMIPLTMLAERPVIWATGLAIAVWLFAWRSWRVSIALLLAMALAEFASLNLNHLLASPSNLVHGGFTSTPTLMAGLVFGMLSAIAGHAMGRWSKAIVAAICGSVVVAIAFSRVYLGAELLSGVLVAAFLALVLASLFGLLIEAIPARRIRPLGLVAFASIVFISVGSLHIDANIEAAETRYAAKSNTLNLTSTQWTQSTWSQLPLRRVDLAGAPEEVFVAQWAGSLQDLESALKITNWTSSAIWSWKDAIYYLDAKSPLEKLPPRPVLHQGLKAKLTMTFIIHDATLRRLVLRAYKAHATISSNGMVQEIYLISITEDVKTSRMGLYAIPATKPLQDVLDLRMRDILKNIPGTTDSKSNTSSAGLPELLSHPKP
jgi:membrane protein DedA with SNARE-associated domain